MTARPKTLDEIKRQAKAINRASGIQHCKALEAVAQAAGFASFHHARVALKEKGPGTDAGAANCVAKTSQTLPGRKAAGVAPSADPTRPAGWRA